MDNFRENIKIEKNFYGRTEKVFNLEFHAYKKFIQDALPGFIAFMEGVNAAITSLEDNYIMSNIQFKARIKDPISCIRNSEQKALDDVFGFEIITPNEMDKEILMLLFHKIFDEKFGNKTKNHNKSNGYVAHHRVGSLKKEIDETEFLKIRNYILNAKMPKTEKPLFPTLRSRIDLRDSEEGYFFDDDFINSMIEAIFTMKKHMDGIESKDVPITEVQFKTSKVAEESINGRASHRDYKPVYEQEIREAYKNKKLMRGMHFPFKFHRVDGKMQLQNSNTTLVEMYPFLKDTIREFKKTHENQLLSCDMHFAIVFPELKPYIEEISTREKDPEPYLIVRNSNQETIWRMLKFKAINPKFSLSDYVQEKNNQDKGDREP